MLLLRLTLISDKIKPRVRDEEKGGERERVGEAVCRNTAA